MNIFTVCERWVLYVMLTARSATIFMLGATIPCAIACIRARYTHRHVCACITYCALKHQSKKPNAAWTTSGRVGLSDRLSHEGCKEVGLSPCTLWTISDIGPNIYSHTRAPSRHHHSQQNACTSTAEYTSPPAPYACCTVCCCHDQTATLFGQSTSAQHVSVFFALLSILPKNVYAQCLHTSESEFI